MRRPAVRVCADPQYEPSAPVPAVASRTLRTSFAAPDGANVLVNADGRLRDGAAPVPGAHVGAMPPPPLLSPLPAPDGHAAAGPDENWYDCCVGIADGPAEGVGPPYLRAASLLSLPG